MLAVHGKVWHPGNFLVAVSGDVTASEILAELERRFTDWPAGTPSPAAPKPDWKPQPGVYAVNKDDVNQTRVSMGHLATTWDDPNAPALEVMNEILGGGGFTSRLTLKVRSEEGLAYSVGSYVGFGRDYPISFRALFQSKNKSAARGIDLSIAEIERLRTEPVSDDELVGAKKSLVESFPQRFPSAKARGLVFVEDELYGRPATWWQDYRGKIEKVTKEDVLRVARDYLRADALIVLVVGKLSEVLAGDADRPDSSLVKTAGTRGVLEIPLPDAGTMVYPHAPRPIAAPQPLTGGS
jgi:predicted Zn-dependent peptidase